MFVIWSPSSSLPPSPRWLQHWPWWAVCQHSLLPRIQESWPPTDWWLRARALPAIQAGARLRLEQEFLLLVLSLESFGVPTPCSRRVRTRKELGAPLAWACVTEMTIPVLPHLFCLLQRATEKIRTNPERFRLRDCWWGQTGSLVLRDQRSNNRVSKRTICQSLSDFQMPRPVA